MSEPVLQGGTASIGGKELRGKEREVNTVFQYLKNGRRDPHCE